MSQPRAPGAGAGAMPAAAAGGAAATATLKQETKMKPEAGTGAALGMPAVPRVAAAVQNYIDTHNARQRAMAQLTANMNPLDRVSFVPYPNVGGPPAPEEHFVSQHTAAPVPKD